LAREERITRPTRTDEWEIVAADKGVAGEWEKWAKQEPNALAAAYDQLASNPTQFSSRQRRLEGARPSNGGSTRPPRAVGSSTSSMISPTAGARSSNDKVVVPSRDAA